MNKYTKHGDKELIALIRKSIVEAGDAAYDKAMLELVDMPQDTMQDMWRLTEALLDTAYGEFDYLEDVPEIKTMVDEAHSRQIKVTMSEFGFMSPKIPEDNEED
jgi:hypothetical protein